MKWKSRRRDVPEWLEPRWCDGALAEEHDLDRFVFNARRDTAESGKEQSPGEIIYDAFYVEHNNNPLPCAALKKCNVGAAILV